MVNCCSGHAIDLLRRQTNKRTDVILLAEGGHARVHPADTALHAAQRTLKSIEHFYQGVIMHRMQQLVTLSRFLNKLLITLAFSPSINTSTGASTGSCHIKITKYVTWHHGIGTGSSHNSSADRKQSRHSPHKCNLKQVVKLEEVVGHHGNEIFEAD